MPAAYGTQYISFRRINVCRRTHCAACTAIIYGMCVNDLAFMNKRFFDQIALWTPNRAVQSTRRDARLISFFPLKPLNHAVMRFLLIVCNPHQYQFAVKIM